MSYQRTRRLAALFLPASLALALGGAEGVRAQTAGTCEKALSSSLSRCFDSYSKALRGCYLATGQPCAATAFDAPAAKLGDTLGAGCTDAELRELGFHANSTVPAITERLREACRGEAAAVAARSFGGPHGFALAGASPRSKVCLKRAHRGGTKLIKKAFKRQSLCVRSAHGDKTCTPAAVDERLARYEARAVRTVGGACPALAGLVAVSPSQFVERALAQARCMVAEAHADAGPLALDCGPRPAVPVPARATTVQVVLDEAVWGTRCGNGSPYAFRLRLAPEGQPVNNVLVYLQGGGVCVFESDCAGRGTDYYEALSETMPTGAIFSSDPSNPFAAWTKVYLPYCTQDLHIGGGTTNAWPSVTVHRFGGVNVRAALRYVRDLVWTVQEAEFPEGYRPDRMTVLLTGESAGGFGAAYNYHYVLDDLGWAHTAAAPDSGLGLDNGELLGLRSLGALVVGDGGTTGWGARPYLPPYCHEPRCAVVPELQASHSPRLKAVPEQQFLVLSNQVDNVQRDTTYFSDTRSWINELRAAYCRNQGLPGLRHFFSASTTSMHGLIGNATRYTTLAADGVVLRDWMGAAFTAPDLVADRVDEGTLVPSFGANAFACLPAS